MGKITEDCNGNKSSKRIMGISMLSTGGAMAIALFVFSLFKDVKDAETALTIIKTLMVAGGGLLGIGIFEKPRK